MESRETKPSVIPWNSLYRKVGQQFENVGEGLWVGRRDSQIIYGIVEAPDEEKPSKNHFGWPPV